MTEDDRDKGKEKVQDLLKTLRGQDRRAGRQEDEGNHGAVSDGRSGESTDRRSTRARKRPRRLAPTARRLASRGSPSFEATPMRTLPPSIVELFPAARDDGPDRRRRSRRQPRAVRRQPPHAAAARAALEEVPREVRRADHQDPARRRLLSMVVDLFEATQLGRRHRRSASSWSLSSRRCRRCKLGELAAVAAVRARPSSCSSSAWRIGAPARRRAGGHGRRRPGDRRGVPQRVQERPRVRGAQRPEGLAPGQGAARRRGSHRPARRRRRRRPRRPGDGRRDPRRRPAASRRPSCTSISR